jgi:hypothetical protein
VYGRPPPALIAYEPGSAATEAVDALLSSWDEFLDGVRARLLQAQEHARRFYDANHRDISFVVGDWVWFRLLHRQTQSLAAGVRGKLGPKYAGPYQVLQRIGQVAYRLRLPDNAQIHDVFHVGSSSPSVVHQR